MKRAIVSGGQAPEAGRRPGEAALDRWTLVHLMSGVAIGLLGVRWWLAVAVLVLYEFAEAGLRRIKLEDGGLFEHESWPNIFADVWAGILGWVCGYAAWRLLEWPVLFGLL